MCRLSAFLQASSFLHRLPLFPHSTLLQTPSFHRLFISFIPKLYFTTVTGLPAPFYKKLINRFFFTIRSLGVRNISDISAKRVLLSQPDLLECSLSLSFDESHNKSSCTRGVLTKSTFFPITLSQAAQHGLQDCGIYPPLDFKGAPACKMNTAVHNVQTLAQTDDRPAHLAPKLSCVASSHPWANSALENN